VRHLTRSIAGAAMAGVSYAFCPYMFSHIPQIQLLMTFGPPLVFLALHRFVDEPRAGRAAWLGAALALQALACAYYAIYGGLAAALGLVWFGVATGRWRQPRYWIGGVAAAVLALAIVLPFFLPYLQIRADGFGRTIDDARLFSADWRAYLASPLLFSSWMLPLLGTWREVLFPGFVPVVLALLAIVRVLHPGRAQPIVRGHVIGFYLVLAGLALWASFGPDAGLYTLLFDTVPLFTFLRAPARLGLIVTMSLAIVGGIGLAGLASRWQGRKRFVFLCALAGLLIARSTPGPLPIVDAPPVLAAYRKLALLPPGPVIEFPYFSGAAERSRQTEYMLGSTYHWKPLVNGYSDHIPGEAFADMFKLAGFPAATAWDTLGRRHARYVVVHWNLYSPVEIHTLAAEVVRPDRGLRLLLDSPDASLFEVADWTERDDEGTVTSTGHQ
jgi:hypothetical protein